jgi:hypothetical protein
MSAQKTDSSKLPRGPEIRCAAAQLSTDAPVSIQSTARVRIESLFDVWRLEGRSGGIYCGMWEITLLGLILMVVGIDLPILIPVGMLVCAAGLVLGVEAKAREQREKRR